MAEKLICAHCGEDCGKDPVIYDGKPFCCQGCRTVYQLLEENKLGQYYTLMDIPQGVKTDENASSSSRYAFLDKEEIKRKLLEFSNEQFSRVYLLYPCHSLQQLYLASREPSPNASRDCDFDG